MPLHRNDLTFEANEARRKFWEICASGAITALPNSEHESVYENWHQFKAFYDYGEFAASLADRLLDEWDKRWIELPKEEGDSK